MSELMAKHWQGRDGGGFKVHVDGLGLIEVYQSDTGQGRVCFINGKQYSGGYRYGLDEMVLDMSARIRDWQYINRFKVQS